MGYKRGLWNNDKHRECKREVPSTPTRLGLCDPVVRIWEMFVPLFGKQVGWRHSTEEPLIASTLGQHNSVSLTAVPELSRPGWIATVTQNTFILWLLTTVCISYFIISFRVHSLAPQACLSCITFDYCIILKCSSDKWYILHCFF